MPVARSTVHRELSSTYGPSYRLALDSHQVRRSRSQPGVLTSAQIVYRAKKAQGHNGRHMYVCTRGLNFKMLQV